MRTLAIATSAAVTAWAFAAEAAQARTGMEEPPTISAGVGAPVLQVNARRAEAIGGEPIERPSEDQRADESADVDRSTQNSARAPGCVTQREPCIRRRGAPADAIPDRALMRQRAIL